MKTSFVAAAHGEITAKATEADVKWLIDKANKVFDVNIQLMFAAPRKAQTREREIPCMQVVYALELETDKPMSTTSLLEVKEMLETAARYAPCQRCTNCSRQYCTAGYIQDLTKPNQKIRRDSEAHTKQQTTLRLTG